MTKPVRKYQKRKLEIFVEKGYRESKTLRQTKLVAGKKEVLEYLKRKKTKKSLVSEFERLKEEAKQLFKKALEGDKKALKRLSQKKYRFFVNEFIAEAIDKQYYLQKKYKKEQKRQARR